jgi:transcriptional regulator with PAS, ATPase and Fis domain
VRSTGDTVDDVTSIVAEAAAPPAVVLVATDRAIVHRGFAVGKGLPIGRVGAVEHGIELDDERVSRQHAEVARRGKDWIVRDLGSRNGTFVDGNRVTGELAIAGDHVVRVGHSVLLLLEHGGDQLARGKDDADAVIGPELAQVHADIKRHAGAPTLLVHGDSGTGKELAARLYHQSGPRADGPFVPVNCAAIPEGVAERLLFGARKGAFSGATDAVGWVQSAHGGTLFLDEVAELDAAVQAKLLRVLESREVVPVGAAAGVRVDLGVVAATHRDLRTAVSERAFRDDLYYRLARPMVHLPPLRARRADIPRLIRRTLTELDRGLAAHAKLVEACLLRPWPGNVRELVHAIRDAATAARGADREVVRVEDLPLHAGELVHGAAPAPARPTRTTGEVAVPAAPAAPVVERTREDLEAALAAAGGNVSAAARSLGLHRTQLYRMLEKHGLRGTADD